VAEQIGATTGRRDLRVARLELSDHASIAAFVAGWKGALDMLVNNAGVMALPDRQLTMEGWEMQFARTPNDFGRNRCACSDPDSEARARSAQRTEELLCCPRDRSDLALAFLFAAANQAGCFWGVDCACVRRCHSANASRSGTTGVRSMLESTNSRNSRPN
jgi:NAD(P)-dependent dehydrogenase (short-subunit alcohol dehydrogenase family)